jgi:polyphosphate kinase
VEIDLIIRGVCTLLPGVKGMSENIRVRSIVGRFLEHSRIFQFANGGKQEIYMGSADWMPRNLFERCEVVFPVNDKAAKARIHDEILASYLVDTAKARLMQDDGSYVRANGTGTRPSNGNHKGKSEQAPFSAQEFLMRLAEGQADLSAIPKPAKAPAAKTHPAKAAAQSPAS